ncbi:hypothetical protein GQ53DRAFT_839081 [Thozetella sp. PMI_491]|nr:hypothetical protein GQ53DRAFT_839081 [Thozetella sp. PMI_491]
MDTSAEETAQKVLEAVQDDGIKTAIDGFAKHWESAFYSLDEAEQESLLASGSAIDNIQGALREAKNAQNRWTGSKVCYRIGDTQRYVYDDWGKVVRALTACQGVVNPLIALDPSGKAALPWAAIQLIINAIKRGHEKYDAASNGMVTISETIEYYSHFERFYKRGDLAVVQKLKEAVVNVYKHILKFLCLAQYYFSNKASDKLRLRFKNIGISPSMFSTHIDSVEVGKQKVDQWAALAIRETEFKVDEYVQKIENHLRTHEHRELLEWLSPVSSLNAHAAKARERRPNTGQWLLNSNEFERWRFMTTSSLFLLTGSVGTGKSTLASLVVDGFLCKQPGIVSSPILYFYCKPGDDPEDILRDLLKQVIVASPDGQERLGYNRTGGIKPSAEECLAIISHFIKTQNSVTIVVDSLDSRVGQGREGLRYPYTKLFTDLAALTETTSPGTLRLLITSQAPNNRIAAIYSGLKQSRKHKLSTDIDQPRHDLQLVVSAEVRSWSEAEFMPNVSHEDRPKVERLKQSLIRHITEKAGRTFLWAVHAARWIRDRYDLQRVSDVPSLQSLSWLDPPKTLKALYDVNFAAIHAPNSSDSSKMAARAMKLLFCSRKRLSSSSLVDALMAASEKTSPSFRLKSVRVDYSREVGDIVSGCRGFVVYDEELDILSFQNPSVEKYLEEKCETESYKTEAHAAMTESCLVRLRYAVSRINSMAQKEVLDVDDSSDEAEDEFNEVEFDENDDDFDEEEEEDGNSDIGNESNDGTSERGRSRERERSQPPSSPRGLHFARVSDPGPRAVSLLDPSGISKTKVGTEGFSASPPRAEWSSSGSRESSVRSQSASSTRSMRHNRIGSERGYRKRTRAISWGTSSSVMSMLSVDHVNSTNRSDLRQLDKDAPLQSFDEYAIIYWLTHYSLCGELQAKNDDLVGGMLVGQDEWNPRGRFNLWVRGVEMHLGERPIGFYGEAVETELEYCIAFPPTPFRAACIYGLNAIISRIAETSGKRPEDDEESRQIGRLLSSQQDVEGIPQFTPDFKGMTELHAACRFGRIHVVKLFKEKLKSDISPFISVDRRERSALNYAVEKAKDTAMVDLLMTTKASRFSNQSSVLIAAMKHQDPKCGESLVNSLLGRDYESIRDQVSPLTKKLIITAITCPFANLKLVRAIWHSSKRPDKFPEILVEAAASRNNLIRAEQSDRQKIWEWLMRMFWDLKLSSRRRVFRLQQILIATIEAGDTELVKIILDLKRVRVLYGRVLTPDVLEVAAMNTHRPEELVTPLITAYKKIPFNYSGLKEAMENPAADVALIRTLRHQIEGTDEDSTRPDSPGLDEFPDLLVVEEKTLIALAVNRKHGADMLQYVLSEALPLDRPRLSQAPNLSVVETAVAHGNVEILMVLLDTLNLELSEAQMFHEIVSDKWGRDIFLKRRLEQPQNSSSASPLQPVGFNRPEDQWDSTVEQCVRLLVEHSSNTELWFSQSMAEKAALVRGRKLMEYLLVTSRAGKSNAPISVSKEILLAATKNTLYGHDLLPLLEKYASDKDLITDDDVVRSAAAHGNLGTATFLLGSRPPTSGPYSREFMLAAAANPDASVVEFLFRYVNPSRVGQDELAAAAANSDAAFECLLRHTPMPKSITPPSALQQALQPSAGTSSVDTSPKDQAQKTLTLTIARHLHRTKNLREACDRGLATMPETSDDTRQLIEAVVQNPDGLEMTAWVLRGRKIEVTTEMLRLAAGNRTVAPEMVRLLLNKCRDYEVPDLIQATVLVAAARNGSAAPDTLKVLLMELGETIFDEPESVLVRDAAINNHVAGSKALKILQTFQRNFPKTYMRSYLDEYTEKSSQVSGSDLDLSGGGHF